MTNQNSCVWAERWNHLDELIAKQFGYYLIFCGDTECKEVNLWNPTTASFVNQGWVICYACQSDDCIAEDYCPEHGNPNEKVCQKHSTQFEIEI